ncbi:choline-binding transcriptional repressor BetI [Boseongicola aestuarii]|uniref:HTH-type transcriptional regulator BetI n=1 Tax=Boseongicola aestuarii TaxID=1470561 RepID=A0A238IZK5_9RHOB|nr:transcriptional regulator BetI [Boseongicola aestuarii]SMX23432.1 HTH-type transcriptional regulator BetI [Boseongicola aestuarii]
MPKLGMEPIRRAALIDATIAEIGATGSLDVTVGQIARRAGVSSGLAHHYFGGKEDILLAAMRHVMREYAREVLNGLQRANTSLARVEAIVKGSFAISNFREDTIAAWLNFYVLALSSAPARRLHRIYAARLRSNLSHALRPLVESRAPDLAARTAALIDGLYLHQGLAEAPPDGEAATRHVMQFVEREIGG